MGFYTSNNRPGQLPFGTKKVRVVNRGGTTALALGDVMAFDLDASQTETKAFKGVGGVVLASTKEAVWHNIVDVGTAGTLNQFICVVSSLLSGAGADNTEVEVTISGEVQASVYGTNWASANTSNGVVVMADVGGSQVRQLIAATDLVNIAKVGFINDNIATDLSSTAALANVCLLGWGNLVGVVGAGT